MNILIIDDREYDALELSTKLSAINPAAAITWCSSSDQALEEINSCGANAFDAVFVDQHMPESLGTDLVRRLDKTLNRKATRVVMLTSDGGDSTRALALVSDCDGFLTKPVDALRLRRFLDGSRCQWELSDFPKDIEHYWNMLDGQQNRYGDAAG